MATDILAEISAQQQDNRPSSPFLLATGEESDDIAIKVQRDCAGAMGAVMAQRAESRESDRYYNGHQWSDVDRMKMEQLKRPAISFNEIMPAIDAVSGLERLNRTDCRFKSRAFDSSEVDDAAGDLATSAVAAVLDLSDGDSERSRAIRDMAIGGLGALEIRVDYERDPDGQIMLERVPPDEMIWDTNARKENLEDRRWCARKRPIPRSIFKQRWPDKLDLVDASAPYYDENEISKYELVTPYYSRANERANPLLGRGTRLSKEIPVIQYQWREMVAIYRIYDEQSPDELRDLSEDQWKKLTLRSQLLGIEPPPAVRSTRPVYKQVYVAFGVALEEPTILPGGFSLLFITGKYDGEKKVQIGIVRPMIDPQNAMNKSISSGLTHMLSNAKGGTIFKTRTFADPEMAKNKWAQPDAWIEANDEADLATDIRERQGSKPPPFIEMLFPIAKQAMVTVSGISPEIVGTAEGETSSPTVGKRIQGGLAVLGWFFDNITRHRRNEARLTLEFVREYWSHGQLVSVGGSFNGRSIPLFKSDLPMNYTLELDDSVRHNPNLKAQVWQDMQPLIPALLRFGFGRFLLTALKFSPLPAQLVAELQKEAQAMSQQPQQGKGRGKQEDPMLVQAKVRKLSADAEKARAEARGIDQEHGFKVAQLVTDSLLRTKEQHHQERLDIHHATQDQFAKALATTHPTQ